MDSFNQYHQTKRHIIEQACFRELKMINRLMSELEVGIKKADKDQEPIPGTWTCRWSGMPLTSGQMKSMRSALYDRRQGIKAMLQCNREVFGKVKSEP